MSSEQFWLQYPSTVTVSRRSTSVVRLAHVSDESGIFHLPTLIRVFLRLVASFGFATS